MQRKKERQPRGIARRGASFICSFADKDGRIIRRSVGPTSVQWAVQQREIWKRPIAQGIYHSRSPRPTRYTVADVFRAYMVNFVNKGGRSAERWRLAWRWLEPTSARSQLAT